MKQNLTEFTNIIKHMCDACSTGYGMPISVMRGQLKGLTEALHLQKNDEWRKLCFNWNAGDAKDYLQLTPKELIEYNGMSLRNWDAKDITRKDVLTAINSQQSHLTPRAVHDNKKIRDKLTNKDIVKIATERSYHADDYTNTIYTMPNLYWLSCIKKSDVSVTSLMKLKSFTDWVTKLGLVYYFLDRSDHKKFNFLRKVVKQLGAPKEVLEYMLDLDNFACRYSIANGYKQDWGKKTAVALSTNEDENAEFETYLKMKGIDLCKTWNSALHRDEHYQRNLFGLHECLMSKYNNNIKERNTI